MKPRWVIGVTGGIATGKTSVLRELRRAGVATISSDDLAHACLHRSHRCYRRIVRHFGPGVLGRGGEIDRKKLGAIVFSRPKERIWLERQIHPQVQRQLRSFIRKHRGILALDIPLLFEAKLKNLVDTILVVGSSQRSQLARLKRRNGLDPSTALKRIQAQWPLALKKKQADYVIENDRTPAILKKRVKGALEQIRQDIAKSA